MRNNSNNGELGKHSFAQQSLPSPKSSKTISKNISHNINHALVQYQSNPSTIFSFFSFVSLAIYKPTIKSKNKSLSKNNMNINIVQHLSPGWVWPLPIATTTFNNRNFNIRVIWVWVRRLNDFVRLFRWCSNIRLIWFYLDVYSSRGSLQLVASDPLRVVTDQYLGKFVIKLL